MCRYITRQEEYTLIKDRVKQLRSLMEERNIDLYLVPTSDFHESEYVGEHFNARKFMSGFTGSAGTLVVTRTEAGLWTDGRYFIQAENELKDSGIKLFKMGVEKVPSVEAYIEEKMTENGVLGFDGRVVNAKLGQRLEEKLKTKKNATIAYEEDLIDTIWTERPQLSKEPAFLLDVKYSGKSTKEKLIKVREAMEKKNASAFILTSLDDIAWLFNIRGNDIPCNPVVLSYAVITKENAYFFADVSVIDDTIQKEFEKDQIEIKEYEEIYAFVKEMKNDEVVLCDTSRVNYKLFRMLDSDIKIVDQMNPTTKLKAIKNSVEIENLRRSHVKDGVAVTKFMYWLKNNYDKMPVTELSASDYIAERRKEQEGFIELSFHTISAYGANAAMMHYSANETSNATLEQGNFLLVDSGGQYYEGTTDITRTFALGTITDELKKHYTLVTKSMLNLANAKFLYGCTGQNLDILARGPLWDIGIDYRCGTGHGVGYLLNVHEAPNGFRWRIVPERNDSCVLEEGMVTTDEPGVYIEGSHGIRIENELVCRKDEKNEYGQFMSFETITYAPIDLDAIDVTYLDKKDIKQLNEYHQMVYDTISPYLTQKEQEWLRHYTRAI